MGDMGIKSHYTVEKANIICQRIASGESLRSICKEESMPCEGAVFNWLMENPEFDLAYARARETQAEVMAQEIKEIADSCREGIKKTVKSDGTIEMVYSDMTERAKIQIAARQWLAERLKPKRFGNATILRGDKDNPIEIGLSTALESIATRRLPAIESQREVIDLVPLPVKAEDFI